MGIWVWEQANLWLARLAVGLDAEQQAVLLQFPTREWPWPNGLNWEEHDTGRKVTNWEKREEPRVWRS